MSTCGFFRSKIGSTLLRFRHILKLTLADLLIFKRKKCTETKPNELYAIECAKVN